MFQSPEVSDRRVSALNAGNVLECKEGLAAEVVGRDDVVIEDGELDDSVVAPALVRKGRTEKNVSYKYPGPMNLEKLDFRYKSGSRHKFDNPHLRLNDRSFLNDLLFTYNSKHSSKTGLSVAF